MPDWLGPNDPWPHHSRGDANRELRAARAHGWWFKPGGKSAHIFGRLCCRAPGSGQRQGVDECSYPVYSTAGGDTAQTAENIRDLVRSCNHHQDSDVELTRQQKIDLAIERMDDAERLIIAAEILSEDEARRVRVADLVDQIDDIAAAAERLLQEALDVDDERSEMLAKAAATLALDAEILEETGDVAPAMATALDGAETALDDAGRLLTRRAAKYGAEAEARRLSALRERAQTLRRSPSLDQA